MKRCLPLGEEILPERFYTDRFLPGIREIFSQKKALNFLKAFESVIRTITHLIFLMLISMLILK